MAVLYPFTESLATSKGITRQALLKRVLRESGLGDYGTATDGGTTYLIDTTKLKSSQYSPDEWVDGWMRISKNFDSAGSAPENSIRPITTYTPSSGQIDYNPSVTAIATSDEYELWRFPNPQAVLDIIDQVLKNDIYLPCWSPVSEVPDFDMDQSGTSDWSSSSATIAKSTTAPVMSGKRYLTVVTTSAGGYAESAVMLTEPGKKYYVGVLVRNVNDNMTATLSVRDYTNDAEITSKTHTNKNLVRLWLEFTTPATFSEITIRMANVGNTVTSYWDELILFGYDQQQVALPWWVEDREQVKGIFQLSSLSQAADKAPAELIGEQDYRWDIMDTSFGRGKLMLRARTGTCTQPLFIFGIRNETVFDNDTADIKLVDEDYLAACWLYKLFDVLFQEPREGYLDAKWAEKQYFKWKQNWEDESFKMHQRINSVLNTSSPRAYYSHPLDNLGW